MSSNDKIEHIVAPYLTVATVITQPLSTLLVMVFIYGIYVVVFGLSVHILSRRDGRSLKLYMGWTISLFGLATLYTVTYIWGMSWQAAIEFSAATTKDYKYFLKYLSADNGKTAWISISIFTSCIMNVIADSMLIHRCYTIWQSKIILYLLAVIAVILNGISLGCAIIGIIGASTANFEIYDKASAIDNATAIAVAVFQVLLALLTGKIANPIALAACRLDKNARYNSITSVVIESGMLYAGCLIGLFAFQFIVDPDTTGVGSFDFAVVSTLMSGLAPTLIIVRVWYGTSVDSVQQMMSTLQFADALEESTQKSRPIASLQLQRQIDNHVRSESGNSEPPPLVYKINEKMV
ncbi:hypothetical protein L218DRAFT_994054 [Marasmius fiardii PR-910]|nr:hypothetical protein L218DRAFT_994054 [Marasmius fiardii PR-910]